MPEPETIEFVQIATAKEHLYGMTRQGAVWKYDVDRELWEPLSMAFSSTPKRRGFEQSHRV